MIRKGKISRTQSVNAHPGLPFELNPENLAIRASSWSDNMWKLFSSPKLAFILICLIAVASLAGALITQAPIGVRDDPTSYARWLAQIRPKYGMATAVLNSAGLFNVFGTWWFRLLMAFLAANIMVCSMNRGGRILRAAISKPKIVVPDTFFKRAKLQNVITVHGLTAEEGEAALRKSLRRGRYRVLSERSGDALHLFADRNRFAPAGTLLHHLSLVATLVGFLVGNMLGYEDRAFVVAEGTTKSIGNTGLAVSLETFADEYYTDGMPKDYVSHVVLLEQGEKVREADVRVNSPLLYNGTRLHQSFFGPAAVLEVHDGSGALIAQETVPLSWRSRERPVGSFLIPSRGLEIFIIGPASGFIDSVIAAGQVRMEVYNIGDSSPFTMSNLIQGQPETVGGITYTFVRERQFSGFQVINNPGRPILWASAIAMVLGLMWVIYFPHRQIWLSYKPLPDGTSLIQMGAAKGKWGSFTRDFNKTAEGITRMAVKAGGDVKEQTQEVS